MTTANKITIVRILLVPVFVAQMIHYPRSGNEIFRLLALLTFAIASISDGIDGYIARRYHQQSELGTFLDPLADKLLLTSAIILLSLDNGLYFQRIPLWLTEAILSRDVLLLIGAMVIHHTAGKMKVRPRMAGKIATVFQMSLVIWILLHWDKDFVPWLAGVSGIFTAISGVYYLSDFLKQLNASPASSPARPE